MADYTPVPDRAHGGGGHANRYTRFILEDLIPFIDSEYRTIPEPDSRGLGGSSLGGLVTLYIALRHPETFGKLIVMSPSVWWGRRAILREVKRFPALPSRRPRIWLDVGTNEGSNPAICLRDVRGLRAALLLAGWREGDNVFYLEDQGGTHSELAWGARIRSALLAFFPSRPSTLRIEQK